MSKLFYHTQATLHLRISALGMQSDRLNAKLQVSFSCTARFVFIKCCPHNTSKNKHERDDKIIFILLTQVFLKYGEKLVKYLCPSAISKTVSQFVSFHSHFLLLLVPLCFIVTQLLFSTAFAPFSAHFSNNEQSRK